MRAVAEPLSKYGASVSIIVLVVGWPLTGEDTGNVDAGRREYSGQRRGTCSEEMGKKASTNCSMSEIALYSKKFVMGTIFSIGKLHLSPLHIF